MSIHLLYKDAILTQVWQQFSKQFTCGFPRRGGGCILVVNDEELAIGFDGCCWVVSFEFEARGAVGLLKQEREKHVQAL